MREVVELVNGLPMLEARPSSDSLLGGDSASAELTRRPRTTVECVARFHICGNFEREKVEDVLPSDGCTFVYASNSVRSALNIRR